MHEMNIQSVAELLSLEFYRFKRYKIPITLVLVEIDVKDFFEVIEAQIRKTDLYQQIDKHLYAIIYTHTDGAGATAAIQNIFSKVDTSLSEIKLAIEEAKANDTSEQDVVSRAFSKLVAYVSSS